MVFNIKLILGICDLVDASTMNFTKMQITVKCPMI